MLAIDMCPRHLVSQQRCAAAYELCCACFAAHASMRMSRCILQCFTCLVFTMHKHCMTWHSLMGGTHLQRNALHYLLQLHPLDPFVPACTALSFHVTLILQDFAVSLVHLCWQPCRRAQDGVKLGIKDVPDMLHTSAHAFTELPTHDIVATQGDLMLYCGQCTCVRS